MKLSEEEIRKITLNAINELGENATPETVKKVVYQTVNNISSDNIKTGIAESSGKIIITSFGMNKTGIVAAITSCLSKLECDIQDLSQKIMGEFFTVIMIVDISDSPNDFKVVQEELQKIQDELKIKIYAQHEDIFRSMHRI